MAFPPKTRAGVECNPQGSVLERNFCATVEAERTERLLAEQYEKTRRAHAADPNASAALVAAHESWQKFRDDALAAAFPCWHDDLTVCFGEETPGEFARFRTRLMNDWLEHLRDIETRIPSSNAR